MARTTAWWKRYPLVALTLVVLILVLALHLSGLREPAQWIASVYVLGIVVWTGIGMVKDMLRGHWGLDILAVVAMISTVAVGEYIAAVLIVLMLTGGEALEVYASGRAKRELDALLERAPRRAHRVEDGTPRDIPVQDVAVGDLLLVKSAEVVPVDGTLEMDAAETDESSLTGEGLPVSHERGDLIMSGSINTGAALVLRATATAAQSQYQQIVNLVQEAQDSKAPVVRLADRFAIPFTAVSLLIASLAWWFSGDPVRFAEVLVLATPCPLLIGAPVAFISGMSRSARNGVLVKSGSSIEQLANARTAAFDKTGTLTGGKPVLTTVHPAPGVEQERLLQLVASVEQFSTHALAESVVNAAADRNVGLLPGHDAVEIATDGVQATVSDHADHRVSVGKRRFIESLGARVPAIDLAPGELAVYAAVDGTYAGTLLMRDALRNNAGESLQRLRELGVAHRLILTGDAHATAQNVADELGVSDVHADLLPADKVSIVAAEPDRPVVMVGDGVNDAPVLAAADVGIAMGARGATAASESADVVILADDIGRVPTAVAVAQRTLRIALTSIWVGICLSLALMLVAAFGHIPAVVGALTQEVVDLVAIGIALTALSAGRKEREWRPSGTTRAHSATERAPSAAGR